MNGIEPQPPPVPPVPTPPVPPVLVLPPVEELVGTQTPRRGFEGTGTTHVVLAPQGFFCFEKGSHIVKHREEPVGRAKQTAPAEQACA